MTVTFSPVAVDTVKLDVATLSTVPAVPPAAGPYRIFRMIPSKAFGLPGQYGMDKFEKEELPKPTRWEFGD